MKYEVWLICTDDCPDYAFARVRRTTTDPVEAIDYSILFRDKFHVTEIRIVEND